MKNLYNTFDTFSFSTFRVIIRAEQPVIVPEFKGSTINGAFKHSLKKAACILQSQDCNDTCIIYNSGQCIYQYLFKARVPKTGEFKKDQNIKNPNGIQPSPFILSNVPGHGKKYLPGEIFTFDILLIGDAVKYISDIIYVFKIMCEAGIGKGTKNNINTGKCLLQSVFAIDINGKKTPVYQYDTQIKRFQPVPITLMDIMKKRPCPHAGEHVTFQFNSRLVIEKKRKNLKKKEINFQALFSSLLYRIYITAKLYCNIYPLNINFSQLDKFAVESVETITSSLFYVNAKRYSNRQKKFHPFGGNLGEIEFKSNNWEIFWPFLLLGEQIHIGKKSSFGFGSYSLKYKPSDN